MTTILYHPESDAPIDIANLSTGATCLQIGEVNVFPQPGQLEQIRAAINAYLAAKNRCACGHPAHPEGQCRAVVVVDGVRSVECPCLGSIGG